MAQEDNLADASIFTTDAVLSEFLTFFASDPRLRNRAARTVAALSGFVSRLIGAGILEDDAR